MNRCRTRLLLRSLEDRASPSVVPVGSEYRVNTYTTNTQSAPTVAMDQAGDYVAAWQSYGQEGGFGFGYGSGIYAQRYNSAGQPQGGEFHVNTYTTSDQYFPVVAMDQAGDFVVAWESKNQDGSN